MHDRSAASTEAARPTGRSGGLRVLVLAFGVFAVGTDEFVLAGLLPRLGSSMDISIATAGQVVTAFGLTCALLTPVLATLTTGWRRRPVLLGSLLVYLVGNVATALAPSFELLLIAQIVAAAGTGLFVPTAAVTASSMVEPERRGRVLAIVTTGFTTATALGAPIGTALGGQFGWRATIWFVAALAVLGLVGVLAVIPRTIAAAADGAGAAPDSLRDRIAPLADRRVLPLLATTLAAFGGLYIPYTYIAAVFEPATHGSADALAALLLAFGLTGTVANLCGGFLVDRFGGRKVVTAALTLLTVCMLVLPLATGSLAIALPMVVIWSVAAWTITAPQQYRLITLRPESAAVLVSLNAAIIYLAISLSGVLGAVGMGWVGAGRLGLIAAVLTAAAIVLSELGHRAARRHTAPAAAGAAAEPAPAEQG
ncbi:MFS transporter [Streptomyces sp. NPDC057743]|uniref:MFS transporter n=1 Tax=Streptomyces sp. NPDC057743 TaxID=3346236 RepID=UPI00369EFB17